MSYHAGLRALRNGQSFRSIFRQTFQRRWASSTAEATTQSVKPPSQNPFSWNSPVGPKTVHFWAPVMKWILVGVSVSDFARPADQLSMTQSAALMATGAIWTRWCLIIKPKNYLLAAVNFFLFLANGTQVARIVSYQRAQSGRTIEEQAKAATQEVGDKIEGAAKDAKAKAKEVVAAK